MGGIPPTLTWEVAERGGRTFVRCEFRESDDLGTREFAPQMFSIPQLLDPTTRNYILLSYIHSILGKRMDARTVYIRELIDHLDAEGEQ